MKTKIIVILLSLALLFSIAACGNPDSGDTQTAEPEGTNTVESADDAGLETPEQTTPPGGSREPIQAG